MLSKRATDEWFLQVCRGKAKGSVGGKHKLEDLERVLAGADCLVVENEPKGANQMIHNARAKRNGTVLLGIQDVPLSLQIKSILGSLSATHGSTPFGRASIDCGSKLEPFSRHVAGSPRT
jgi:hypothetical protein